MYVAGVQVNGTARASSNAAQHSAEKRQPWRHLLMLDILHEHGPWIWMQLMLLQVMRVLVFVPFILACIYLFY